MSGRISLLDGKRLATLLAYVLVFLILVFPTVPQLAHLKEFLFAVILVTIGITTYNTGHRGLHPTVALWTFSLAALSFLLILEGFFTGTPGADKIIGIYIIWPIIYGLVIVGVRNERILLGLIKTALLSTICIALYSVLYALTETHILPENRFMDFLSFDWKAQQFYLEDGFIHMTFAGVNSLPFLVPFSLAALVTFLPRAVAALPLRRIWLWTAGSLGLLSVLLSGRRALFLVILTTPLLTLLFLSFQPMAQRRLSRKALVRTMAFGVLAVVVSLACLNASYGVTLTAATDRFTLAFDFSPTTEDTGATERREQFHALLAGWMENPILGAGHGASAYGSIRSELTPWNYELYYMALLYQTGLVGFAAYVLGVIWIYWKGVQVIRDGGWLSALMVACLVGMSSFLIANATNPYIAGLDGMWTIFFPLALINFWLLRRALPQTFVSS